MPDKSVVALRYIKNLFKPSYLAICPKCGFTDFTGTVESCPNCKNPLILAFCPGCGETISGDVKICPHCKTRVGVKEVKIRREGFKLEEVPEYIGRKSEAIGMVILGIVIVGLSISAFFIGLISGEISVVIAAVFGCLIGGFFLDYGQHYWKKVTHIMWTRQALREYGVPSRYEEKRLITKKDTFEREVWPEIKMDSEEETRRYLDLLDRQLIEGRLSEETYKKLQKKYESKLKRIKQKSPT